VRYADDHWEYDGHNRVRALVVGLSPIWLLAFALLTRSPFGGGVTQPTEAQIAARQVAQLAGFGLAGLLMLAGTVAIWRARSTRAALGAMLLLTLPALILFILGPAFALILLSSIT
jgi:hypothetical protein